MLRFAVYFLLANVIGGFFLWLAARDLPFDQIGGYLEQADMAHLGLWAGVFVLIYAVCHWARIFRWSYLVRPLGDDIDTMTVHRVCTVGFTAIILLPLRLGELVRPYLLARRTELPMSGVLATAVVERVLDGLLMTGLLFVTLAFYSGDRATGFATTAGLIAAAIFVPALLVCLLAFWRKDWTLELLRRIGNPISEGLTEKATGMLDEFIKGFRGLLEADELGRYLFITALYWFTNILSMWVLAHLGFGLDVTMWEVATVLPILVIGIMIPAGPGLAGNFEYFMAKGLALFVAVEVAEVGAKVAVFAAAVHVLQFLVIVIPGFFVMWSDPEARHLIQLSKQAEEAVPHEDA
ncbi:flippase-like domain-containing protein [Persicimonas caeni]|uniref:Flippase-like domain-containing protein n=1 Tax=Persicimonas caeni TaxID=2292766 RepID=A0A4Y6Q0G8_PERCE|nr:lysylphosphatidylglycerol synthase transmembrane domain-containing protein [Persicimonas caeni]QDG54064.1 flippase-like domain-containing protein [Persicimonas caeni]QED35285.1 flippase-like domain-containing protein [Persicimonas caeni]